MDHVIIKRVLRGSWICVVLVGSILAVYWLIPLVYPFLIAWLISYAMNPFVLWLQKSLRVPKWLAVTLSLLIYFGSAGIIVSAALTRLVKELIHLAESFDLRIAEWRICLSHGRKAKAFSRSLPRSTVLSPITPATRIRFIKI
ncbi:hypothetical protein HMSSN139_66560 [Paenibacillus sp. HMSSN-139]|nr:hypothetical protein HMSSN139_66560 [Paenibacillus sp. HMSSN-139]